MSTSPSTASSKSADGLRAEVSVLIPVGEDEFLADCLESVRGQRLKPREILIFVDGRLHWDSAFEKVIWGDESIDMLIVPSGKVGVTRARNELMERARSDFFAFLDADDIWEPEYLERQVESLQGSNGPAISIAGVTHFLSPGVLISEIPPQIQKVIGIMKKVAVPSSLVTTRQVFELVGPFDEEFPCSSDVDWMLRANHAGVRRLDVGVPLVRKRVHRRCLSLNQADLAEEIMRVIRKNRP